MHKQRVARSEFCLDGECGQNEIQIECCARAAPARQKGPELKQVNAPRDALLPQASAICR
jgi:hypothetical protein